jgi:rod shape-determining protein MreC
VYDKTVRRRRAVLGLLIACSLILLTAYFGESSGGSLHAVQRGVMTVVSPIQNVASTAVSPVRNLFNWISDTFHAKGDVKDLRKQNTALLHQNIALNEQLREAKQIAGLKVVDTNAGLAVNDPKSATVIAASQSAWFRTVVIDKGTSDGVREGMPVIGADEDNGGLIGKVSNASSNAAVVQLITDDHSYVSAEDVNTGVRGGVGPTVGNPGGLNFEFPGRDTFTRGDIVITSGTCSTSTRNDSLFPRGVPIGTVTRVDGIGTNDQQVHVKPYVDLHRVDDVQVLTRTVDGNRSNACP